MCFLRDLSEASAFRTLEEATPHLDQISGVGLDSTELGQPPAEFERVHAAARQLGLACVAHAGEEGPPEYVWQAIDRLSDHPLEIMLDEHLLVTVNSDDPADLGGYVDQNYLAVAEALDLDQTHITRLAQNSFSFSLLGDREKQGFLTEVDRCLEGFESHSSGSSPASCSSSM